MDMKGRRGKQAYYFRGEIRWEEGSIDEGDEMVEDSIDVLGLFQKKKDYAYKNCRVVQDKGEMHVIGDGDGRLRISAAAYKGVRPNIETTEKAVYSSTSGYATSVVAGDRNARVVLPKRRKAQSSNRIKPNYLEWYDRLNKTQGVQEIFQAAGVADAIAASITVIPKDVSLLEWIIGHFSRKTRTFLFPWGVCSWDTGRCSCHRGATGGKSAGKAGKANTA